MYDAAPPPPPPPAAGPAASARYVYLLSRLRNRQITMEEATELFSVMQGMIRAAAAPAPPPPAEGAARPPSAPSKGGWQEDSDWMVLLGLGVGAGLGAALVKRLSGGPPPPSRPKRSDPSA